MSRSPNNMSRYGWSPDIIVMHVCEGGFDGSVSWLCNPASGASSHYVTGTNGQLAQLVDLDRAAWCNGTSTLSNSSMFYGKATSDLVRNRKTNANYYSISIENEGFSYKNLKGGLTEPQYNTLLNLCKELITKYPAIQIDRQHIIGHYQISPTNKPNCPGDNFPWDRLINDLLAWKGQPTPAPIPSPSQPQTTAYNEGDVVTYSSCYLSSTDPVSKAILLKSWKTGTITRVIRDGRQNPYLINNGACWVNNGDIRGRGNVGNTPAPTPAQPTSFRVGQRVTLQGFATNYATGQFIPVSRRNKVYTIMQVSQGKVLLKEIMSWVLNQDIR